jgi:hypothetical protein
MGNARFGKFSSNPKEVIVFGFNTGKNIGYDPDSYRISMV